MAFLCFCLFLSVFNVYIYHFPSSIYIYSITHIINNTSINRLYKGDLKRKSIRESEPMSSIFLYLGMNQISFKIILKSNFTMYKM